MVGAFIIMFGFAVLAGKEQQAQNELKQARAEITHLKEQLCKANSDTTHKHCIIIK